MTDITIAATNLSDAEATADLSSQILAELKGDPPDALLLCASRPDTVR